jgi:hypothetical protein
MSVQGSFAHAGFSTKYAKVNLSDGSVAGTGTSGVQLQYVVKRSIL